MQRYNTLTCLCSWQADLCLAPLQTPKTGTCNLLDSIRGPSVSYPSYLGLIKVAKKGEFSHINPEPYLWCYLTKLTQLQSKDKNQSFPISILRRIQRLNNSVKLSQDRNFNTNQGPTLCCFGRNLPICNSRPLLPDINSYTKFEYNWSRGFNTNQGP